MKDNVLLVEGIDDWHTMRHIIQGTEIEIGYCGNITDILEKLSGLTEASNINQKIIGAILDADDQINDRIRSLRDRLGKYYKIPNDFPSKGLISKPSNNRLPILGIWLMPNNINSGIFEDLLRQAISSDSDDYITRVVEQAKEDNMTNFRDVEKSKAIIKTHIAWQNPNMKNVGEAINTCFDNLSLACKDFLNWIDELFIHGN